jgi:predicted 3-demethylubiquinone-9 3-methyltransferase (glyoxalase superfamily)
MFTGAAEEAVRFYVSLFHGSELRKIEHFGAGEGGAEGSVKRCEFALAGHEFMCFDSPPVHAFTFTPSTSIYVDCDDAAELEQAFAKLSANGEVLMPLDNYGFSTRFGWTKDRFGVSWQLNLP